MSAGEFVLSLAVHLDDVDDEVEVHGYLLQIAGGMVAGVEALVTPAWVRIAAKADPARALEPDPRAVQYRTLDVVVPPRWPRPLVEAAVAS